MIKIDNTCKKLDLPNGKYLDILPNVAMSISKYIQYSQKDDEAGGIILGYSHYNTNNITLEKVTTPKPKDIRTRVFCRLSDPIHKIIARKSEVDLSCYMGVWHTHPQPKPIPSPIDWEDWYDTLNEDVTAGNYTIFLIAGTTGYRVWAGDRKTKEIIEIHESYKEGDLYKKV